MMNFFERRKRLKGVNYLELTPIRRFGEEINDQNLVSILVPRFENQRLRKVLTLRNKNEYVRFKLDSLGSAVWLAIDGERTVFSISQKLQSELGEQFKQADERITRFLSELYFNKMITYKEIEG